MSSNSNSFYDYLTSFKINENNIDDWYKKLKFVTISKNVIKILNRYEVSNLEEYFNLIKYNIKNSKNIKKIKEKYETIKKKELLEEQELEKERINKLLKTSIKKINDNLIIKMLTDENEEDASKLYIQFKEIMGENKEDAEDYVKDFILKNIMFGLFKDNELIAFVIIDYNKKFKIDYNDNINDTFYIQEILVDYKYTNNKYGELLMNYCIYRCPSNISYISLMTKEINIAMKKLAEKLEFKLQERKSGDSLNPLLYIRNNDKIERKSY